MDARSIASSMNSSRPFSPFEPKASTLDSPLHRSATTSRMLTPTPPRAFGGTIYMMKDEHERERQRWQTRMEEIEERLALSETLNSDMNNIKADLNKKIVELEKTQKPIGDQNRKLAERNKNLSHEQKRIEKEMAEMKDALITIRDSHDRLTKENAHLREKRVFPQEKMDELERLRTQILEHSKCITALRQSGLEKDRRYDVMVQKFKRLKKCIRKTSEEPGDDNRSTVESTCSEGKLTVVGPDFGGL
ncbi:unnamed protein product, partial [Mesorhabditis belari]|uniref:Uncharacterized protein n=1 Tax=Mesorhabditis belari TaxID=2138241 RepID=A0AAF3ERY0_9BILA